MKQLVESDENLAIPRLSSVANIRPTSLHTILRKDLGMKSYKPQIKQKDGDASKRLEFCMKVQQMVEEENFDVGAIIFSNESHIYLKSKPNKQNWRQCGVTKPSTMHRIPLHSHKITVWSGIDSNKLWGPFL